MDVAACEHLGDRVTDHFADTQLALRAAGWRMIALMMSGHGNLLDVIIREGG
jgi:hypothetical protein